MWPALLPPWAWMQREADEERISTSWPLPSSPHWVPRTMVAIAGLGVFRFRWLKMDGSSG